MTKIVVGVDGSDGAAEALRWAADAGERRQEPVVAVMAWGYLDQRHPTGEAEFDPEYGEPQAQAALDAALAAALGDRAGAVEGKIVCGLAADSLVEEAGPEDLLVVGARGLGGFKGLLLGSVSQRCLNLAKGPVAVVRGRGAGATGPVVVGVDGSPASRAAVAWAATEAEARGVGLTLAHGWSAPFVGAYPFGASTFDPRLFEEGAREVLDAALVDLAASDLEIEPVLRYGTGGSAILEVAEGASLVVVGSRGFSGLKGWILGSVSNQVVHHSPGSVVVIPTPA